MTIVGLSSWGHRRGGTRRRRQDGRLYLLSAAYSSLLVVDPQTLSVQDVYALPSLGNMTDVVVSDSTVYVLAHQRGRDVVHELTGLQDT